MWGTRKFNVVSVILHELYPSLFIVMFLNDRDKDVGCWSTLKISTDEIMHHKTWAYTITYFGWSSAFVNCFCIIHIDGWQSRKCSIILTLKWLTTKLQLLLNSQRLKSGIPFVAKIIYDWITVWNVSLKVASDAESPPIFSLIWWEHYNVKLDVCRIKRTAS